MLIRLAIAAALAGCGASESIATPPPCPDGDVRVVGADDAAALAECTRIAGDLVIDGAALREVEALGRIDEIAGSLTVGPTLQLTSVGGLRNLRAVGDNIDVSSNLALGGVFFENLATVSGDVEIDRNREAATVSLHRLETVGGNVEISGNASLLRVDLGRLKTVGGDLRVHDNRQLDDVVIGDARVSGERFVDAPGT